MNKVCRPDMIRITGARALSVGAGGYRGKLDRKIQGVVLLGDGEIQEGMVVEARWPQPTTNWTT